MTRAAEFFAHLSWPGAMALTALFLVIGAVMVSFVICMVLSQIEITFTREKKEEK
jgi:hypothetical protein